MTLTPVKARDVSDHTILNARFGEVDNAIQAVQAPPTGLMLMYAGSSAPDGYLLCDGSGVSRTSYADLFAVLGTTFGAGNGSTTFNLPDMRGRTPIGVGQGAGLTNRTLGQQIGAETHVLTEAEMAAHTHGGNGAIFANQMPTGTARPAYDLTITGPSGSTGSDQSHPNIQPSRVINFIIKA